MQRCIILLMAFPGSMSSYDEFLSCDRGQSARSARTFEAIREYCDLSKHNYCKVKGPAYPESAIRAFVVENMGLIRRMGGELEAKEVKREMRSNSWLVSNSHISQEREEKTGSFSLGIIQPLDNMFNGLSGLNINGQEYLLKQGSGLAMVKNAKDEVLQSRSDPEEPLLPMVFRDTTKRPSARLSTSESVRTSTSQTTMRVSTSQSSSPPTTTMPTTTTPTILPSTVTTEIPSTTTDWETIQTTWQLPTEQTTVKADIEEGDWDQYEEGMVGGGGDQEEDIEGSSMLETSGSGDIQLDDLPPQAEFEDSGTASAQIQEEQVEEEIKELEEEKKALEEQIEEELMYLGDSINACDVDMTIEAPFWANNTGGQLLALLNLYPFEQYIHIETCQAEMQEGLCRSGCRCEQQYRLHRLLAFDPTNECRGIFSDWFRFPSFCLCKCYGAKEMLQGSRNPKKAPVSSSHQHHDMFPASEGVREAKDNKLSNHRLTDLNVPAVFPYEGRAALFAELQQYSDQEFAAAKESRTKALNDPTGAHKEEKEDSLETVETLWSLGSTGHMANTVESGHLDDRKTRKLGRGMETEHFFYNQPIMEYVLSDGTEGTLKQTPRK